METTLIGLILLLAIRFIFLKEGTPLSGKRLTWMGVLFPVAFVCFIGPLLLAGALALILFTLHVNVYFLEHKRDQSCPGYRLVIGLASFLFIMVFSAVGYEFGYPLKGNTCLPNEALAVVAAVFLCLKESNFAIRWLFQHYKLMETVDALEDAPKTENGRIIGSLERLLLLLFLWEGAALAAGFIVAVKGLARFKKMEEHQAFAEYVIIGTFLSILLTLLIYKSVQLF